MLRSIGERCLKLSSREAYQTGYLGAVQRTDGFTGDEGLCISTPMNSTSGLLSNVKLASTSMSIAILDLLD